jgi:hypothetical protein
MVIVANVSAPARVFIEPQAWVIALTPLKRDTFKKSLADA